MKLWWYGRGNSGGSWLPEEKKANMWHGRGNSGCSQPPSSPARVLLFFIRGSLEITRTVPLYLILQTDINQNDIGDECETGDDEDG